MEGGGVQKKEPRNGFGKFGEVLELDESAVDVTEGGMVLGVCIERADWSPGMDLSVFCEL